MAHRIAELLAAQEPPPGLPPLEVDSCGLYGEPEGSPTHPGTVRALRAHHGGSWSKPSRHWRPQDYARTDLVLAMDGGNFRELLGELGGRDPEGKLRMMREYDPEAGGARRGRGGSGGPAPDVPDPYYTGDFEEVYRILLRSCRALLASLARP